ncbi:MAG: DUF3237 family protein [Sphingomonadales bacterium]|nr:DUF3237 family protein [Sphingomonadales bacterium]
MAGYVPQAELVFEIEAVCSPPVDMGWIDGGKARMIPIIGGSVSGPNLQGEVIPGGADWSIMRDNGVATVDARYAIRASDGTIIQIDNGVTDHMAPREGRGDVMAITRPRFIAPEGPHEWLNHGVYVGTLAPAITPDRFAVRIAIFRMT